MLSLTFLLYFHPTFWLKLVKSQLLCLWMNGFHPQHQPGLSDERFPGDHTGLLLAFLPLSFHLQAVDFQESSQCDAFQTNARS